MAKKTIYVADADLELFEKAKQLAGDSISSVIAQALRDFVQAKEGFQEIVLFIGKEVNGFKQGKHIKFFGKLIAKEDVDFSQNEASDVLKMLSYKLYLTRKDKLLLYKEQLHVDGPDSDHEFTYSPHDDASELKDMKLPAGLLDAAEKVAPGMICEELDI